MDYSNTRYAKFHGSSRPPAIQRLQSADARAVRWVTGQALVALADAIEASTSILLVQSIVPSALHLSPVFDYIVADPKVRSDQRANGMLKCYHDQGGK